MSKPIITTSSVTKPYQPRENHKAPGRLYGLLLIVLLIGFGCSDKNNPVDAVDLFMGTAIDHGQLSPAAALPFGMAKVGPDTYPSGFNEQAHNGYNYNDSLIMGFSHIRLAGEGCEGVGGNILVCPQIEPLQLDPAAYAASYDKTSEKAEPGYYAVRLVDPRIDCEITVTDHVGFQRFRFADQKQGVLLIDLKRGFTEVTDASVRIVAPDRIEGYVQAYHMCHGLESYRIYFSTQVSPAFDSTRIRIANRLVDSEQERDPSLAAVLYFALPPNGEVMIKTGLSTVDCEDARANTLAQIPDWDFGRVRREARRSWQELLERIEIEADDTERTLFYTMLYRSHQMPMRMTGAQKQFRGHDDQIHQADDFEFYDAWSIWDTFRSKYTLLTLTSPQVIRDCMRSFVHFYSHPYTVDPFPTVRREFMVALILDALAKGIDDFDGEKAFAGMQRDVLEFRAPFENPAAGTKKRRPESFFKQFSSDYQKRGYVVGRPDMTLESSYNAWCVARMAELLGKTGKAERFYRMAHDYRNVWDPSIRFFRARDEAGRWLEFPDPEVIDEKYHYEASSWQWRWFVPHDIPGLIDLIGGREKFVEELSYFFDQALYNHSNEHALHASYLFNVAGEPGLTQQWVRRILSDSILQRYGGHFFYPEPVVRPVYLPQPEGYLPEMDDDCGTMAAWYVLSAIGLYQICPGDPTYQISSPLYKKTTLHLDERYFSGKTFVIETDATERDQVFIRSIQLNGKPHQSFELTHEEMRRGGKLDIELVSEKPIQ